MSNTEVIYCNRDIREQVYIFNCRLVTKKILKQHHHKGKDQGDYNLQCLQLVISII